MASRDCGQRKRKLSNALAVLKAEKALLKQQQQRVAAARRAVDRLCCCDACGGRTLATGMDLQLCPACSAEQREQKRVASLAQYGYGPDGRRLVAA